MVVDKSTGFFPEQLREVQPLPEGNATESKK
jgi:hypothetical protein